MQACCGVSEATVVRCQRLSPGGNYYRPGKRNLENVSTLGRPKIELDEFTLGEIRRIVLSFFSKIVTT